MRCFSKSSSLASFPLTSAGFSAELQCKVCLLLLRSFQVSKRVDHLFADQWNGCFEVRINWSSTPCVSVCAEMLHSPNLRLGTGAVISCLPEPEDSPFELWWADLCLCVSLGYGWLVAGAVGDLTVVLCCRSEMWKKELICWWWNQVCRIWISWEKSRTRSVTKSVRVNEEQSCSSAFLENMLSAENPTSIFR